MAAGVGLLLGFGTSVAVLTSALAIEAAFAPAATTRAIVDVVALMLAAAQAGTAGLLVGSMTQAVWSALVTICLVPVALVAVIAGGIQLRSAWGIGAGSGLVAAGMPTLLQVAHGGGAVENAGGGHLLLLFFLVGAAGGLVYGETARFIAGSSKKSASGACVSERSR